MDFFIKKTYYLTLKENSATFDLIGLQNGLEIIEIIFSDKLYNV